MAQNKLFQDKWMTKTVETAAIYLDIHAGRYPQAIAAMERLSLEEMVKLILQYPQANKAFQDPVFEPFWAKYRQTMIVKNSPTFQFMKQQDVSDADFVTGYCLYLIDKAEKKAEVKYEAINPRDHFSFHLVRNRLYTQFVYLSEDTKEFSEELVKTLFNLERFAKINQTPGCLLLAYGYSSLGIFYQKTGQADEAKIAYNQMWKWVHLAQLMEPESEAAINNAYFGNGLSKSTHLNQPTIAAIKATSAELAQCLLTKEDKLVAENQAKSTYEAWNSSKNQLSSGPLVVKK